MNTPATRQLGTFSLAILLVSAHYGLGFLLGTAEQAPSLGAAGSLYAVSLALGILALMQLSKFYWNRSEQIWTLLGNAYGNWVKAIVSFMAWSSLIGIEAAQIISGASILKVLHVPSLPSMIGLAAVFVALSQLPLEKISRLFQILLGLNILALLYTLWALDGMGDYWQLPIEFVPALDRLPWSQRIGIPLSTVLLVMIDMKCQQFLVKAKDDRTLYQACSIAAVLLFLLAFLPTAVVRAAQSAAVLPADIDSKAAIPYLLTWIGQSAHPAIGWLLILSLLVPALGVGSSILRVQTKMVLDQQIVTDTVPNRWWITGVNASLGLGIALKGSSIVGLIVEFYAVYISAVWIPFAAYLLAETGWYRFPASSVRGSLVAGSSAAIAALLVLLVFPTAGFWNNTEMTILIIGGSFAILGLLVGQAIEKLLPLSESPTED